VQDGAPRPLYVVLACMRDIRRRADRTDTGFDPLRDTVRRGAGAVSDRRRARGAPAWPATVSSSASRILRTHNGFMKMPAESMARTWRRWRCCCAAASRSATPS